MVLTKHNDPRMGETTYRLTNIQLGEPLAMLFEPPSDYTIRPKAQYIYRRLALPAPGEAGAKP